jgi:uncharacterized protein
MQALNNSLLRNGATGMGTGLDPFTRMEVCNTQLLSEAELRALYRGSWLIRRVVELLPLDMARAGVDIKLPDSSDHEDVSAAMQVYRDGGKDMSAYSRRVGCGESFRQAMVWGRLFGQGYCVMRCNGGEDPSKPLTKVKSFEGLSVLDRYSLRPAIGTLNPDEPEFYQIASADASGRANYGLLQRIHESRVLVFNGAKIHPYDLQLEGDGGHDSVIQQIYEAFLRHFGAKDAIAKGLSSYSLFKVAISGLGNLLQAPGGQDALTGYLNTVSQQMSLHRIVLQDAEAGKSEFQERSFAGVAENFKNFVDELTAATGYPHYKIWGSVDKAGLADSGGAEAKSWAETVNGAQQQHLADNHRRLFHAIFEALGDVPKEWEVEYPSLYQPSPEELAALGKTTAETYRTYVDAEIITRTQAYQALATGQPLENVLEPLDEADVLTIVDEAEAAGPSAEEELASLLGGGGEPAVPAPGDAPVGEVPPEAPVDPAATVQGDRADDIMAELLGWRDDAGKGGGKGKRGKRTKKPNCTTGRSCGLSCVARAKQCSADLSPAADAVAKALAARDPFDPAVNPLPRGGGRGQGNNRDPFDPASNPVPQRQQQAPARAPGQGQGQQRAPAQAQRYQIPPAREAMQRMTVLGRGANGAVLLDRENNVAIKYSANPTRPPVSRTELQAMKMASDLGVGPKLIGANKNGIAMEALTDYKSMSGAEISKLSPASQKQAAKNMMAQMEKMHRANLLHGDVHPGNVLFNPKTLDVKFIDFGESDPGGFMMNLDIGHVRSMFGRVPVFNNPGVQAALADAEGRYNTYDRVFGVINKAIDEV